MPIGMDADAVRMLADIGFLGVSRGRFDDAAAVFAAVQAVRPRDEVGAVGLALAQLGRGEARGARDVLAAAPQTEAVMAFTCVALARMGDRRAAADLCDELAAMAPGSPLLAVARGAAAAG